MKYTADQMIRAIEASHGVIAAAARVLGCSRNTVKAYIEKYPTVRAKYDEINESVMDEAEGRLIQLLRDKNHKDHFSALRFYLRTKARSRGYVERQEVAGVGEQPLTVIFKPADAD